jgi:hypothetical protein
LTWNSLNLSDAAKRTLDWMALFARAAEDGGVDMPVTVHKPRGRFEPLPLRLVILSKPPEIAQTARKTARRNARKNQRKIDPRTLEAAGYMILITSLDAAAFPPEALATLYRVHLADRARVQTPEIDPPSRPPAGQGSGPRPRLDHSPPPARLADR